MNNTIPRNFDKKFIYQLLKAFKKIPKNVLNFLKYEGIYYMKCHACVQFT